MPVLFKGNFITFMLTGMQNAITLCPLCHANFDCAEDPGWVFYPTDLKYFIQFECDDRERRAREQATGKTSKRNIPDAETYLKRQLVQGLVPSGSIGGLYSPIFFKLFLHNGHMGLSNFLTQERPWHGAPIAALRRCIASLSSLRIESFSDETWKDLRLLHELYFRFPEDYNIASIIPPVPSIDRRPDHRPGFGHDEHPDEGHPGSGKLAGSTRKKRGAETNLERTRKSRRVAERTKDTNVVSLNNKSARFQRCSTDYGRTRENQQLVNMSATSMYPLHAF
jgi:hypothetical protein